MRKTAIIGLAFAGLLTFTVAPRAAILESPAGGATLSGIGFISGWKCNASNITVTIDDGEHLPVAMHQDRADLLIEKTCGATIRHGFIRQINWGYVGDGEHVVVAYDDGVEFDRATFMVGTTGEEFVEEADRRTVVNGFLVPGEIAVLEWNESTQHFELLEVWGGRPYDQAYWRQLEADLDSRAATYANDEFLYAEAANVDTCRAGRLTQAAKDRALEAMNRIRALHNLAPVQYSRRYDQQVQEAVLIEAANRLYLQPPSPSDQCYTEAGVEGYNTSILNWGIFGRDPAGHMVRLTEGISLGFRLQGGGPPHARRWILDPFAAYMSYGQVEGQNLRVYALKVFGFDEEPAVIPRVEVEFVAFPYETYPFGLMRVDAPGSFEPWSFSVVEDKTSAEGNQHLYFESASVRVTHVESGDTLTVSDLYTDTQPIGVPNVLSWQVEGWRYDTLYEVEISNVTMQSGETRSYSYPVFIEQDALEQ